MARRRIVRNGIVSNLAPSFIVGGGAIGASILGGSLQSRIPAGVSNPLLTTGTTLGGFVAPIAVIGAGGVILKQLNRTKRKIKGGRK